MAIGMDRECKVKYHYLPIYQPLAGKLLESARHVFPGITSVSLPGPDRPNLPERTQAESLD